MTDAHDGAVRPDIAAHGPALNRASYDRIAPQWDAVRRDFVGRERAYLDTMLAAAPVGSTVLDLGCGTGRPLAAHVVAAGRRILGVDQSEAMLAIARTHLPSEQWVRAPMASYDPPPGHHGAIVWDSLFHLPRESHEPILQAVVRGLADGGRVMLTVGGSSHPAFTDEMFGASFFYDSNTPEETEAILRGLGCTIVIGEFMNRPDGGRDKGRYAIVAEKSAATR